MNARGLLDRLRRDCSLTAAELHWIAEAIANHDLNDAQVGAFAMAVCKGNLSVRQRSQFTTAMCETGLRMSWDHLPGPVLDKHSTGGVGDCVSLALAPALAACGAYVPMISGRGLGHTGGTLDKLEAIPGVRVDLPVDALQKQVKNVGCVIAAASDQIAPADRRLYAIRDITGTVDSLDLITSSILSKKLAEGVEALVLDVKCGSGAFMSDHDAALELAHALVTTAQGAGVMTTALITDMNQPAASAVGNAVEIIEVMHLLTQEKVVSSRLRMLTETLGGEVLALGGMAVDPADGARKIAGALADGRAAERFGQMIHAQGGPLDFLERWRDRLPAAPVLMELQAEVPGVVAAIDARILGECVSHLRNGQRYGDRHIASAAGLSQLVEIGQSLTEGQTIAWIHAATEEEARAAAPLIYDAFTFTSQPVTPPPLIKERIA